MLTTNWQTSSYSYHEALCLEARFNGTVEVRDSKSPDGPVLSLSPADWQAFLESF